MKFTADYIPYIVGGIVIIVLCCLLGSKKYQRRFNYTKSRYAPLYYTQDYDMDDGYAGVEYYNDYGSNFATLEGMASKSSSSKSSSGKAKGLNFKANTMSKAKFPHTESGAKALTRGKTGKVDTAQQAKARYAAQQKKYSDFMTRTNQQIKEREQEASNILATLPSSDSSSADGMSMDGFQSMSYNY